MATYNVNLADFQGVFLRRELARAARVERSVEYAARDGVAVVRAEAPKDLGHVANSVHATLGAGGPEIVVDAPHAAALEVGSRPHMPPLAPLVAWAKRHGASARPKAKAASAKASRPTKLRTRVKRLLRRLAGALSGAVRRLLRRAFGGSAKAPRASKAQPAQLTDKEAEAFGRALQHAIAKRGTKPRWYVRKSLPRLRRILATRVRAGLRDP